VSDQEFIDTSQPDGMFVCTAGHITIHAPDDLEWCPAWVVDDHRPRRCSLPVEKVEDDVE
jgi:hypothetical protein